MASTNKILRVFLDVNMQKGHRGLSEIARKVGLSVTKITPQEHLVFVNRKGDKIKIFSTNNVISYLQDPLRHRLDLGALQHFAECFGANGFEYSAALRKTLLDRLKGA